MNVTEALGHIERLAPGFSGQLVGATPAEIETMARYAEVALPNDYADYLRYMGQQDGGISWGYAGADMRVSTLIKHYEEDGWRPPHDYVLIGRDEEGRPWSTFLQRTASPSPCVVQFSIPNSDYGIIDAPDDSPQQVAPSLPQFLFSCAFTNLICYDFKYESYSQLQPDPSPLGSVNEILRESGLKPHACSNEHGAFYLANEGAVHYVSPTAASSLIYCYANEEAWIEKILDRLSHKIHMNTHWLEETELVHMGVTERPSQSWRRTRQPRPLTTL